MTIKQVITGACMTTTTISMAEAKARLSELAEMAASGETIVITKRGKPAVQLSRPELPRRAVDLDALRRLTDQLPLQSEDAGGFMRRVRDEERY
jgi:antitoxin (DNA-binding transcriptional repressor) of toxin-antitoxin stability system